MLQVSSSSNGGTAAAAPGVVLVDGLVVQPAYRSTPWEAEQQQSLKAKDKVSGQQGLQTGFMLLHC